ncbi:MAG: M56 family metallopeptidase [Acetatifactor sp.]
MSDKVSSFLADRVFLQILNMSITAGIIILVVLLVRVLLKKAPKIFSYALWGIVLFRLLCPISFSSSVSVFNLMKHPKVNSGEITFVINEQIRNTAEGNRDQNEYTNLTPHIPEYVGFNGHESLKEEVFEGNSFGIDAEKNANEIVEGNEQLEDGFADKDSNVMKDNHLNSGWLYFLCTIWILGIFVLVSVNAIRYIRLRKKVSASLQLRENIYLCDDIQTPFCLGVINPKIYLPSILEKEEMEYIILHERHHIKRLDHVVKLLAFFALCIHWFNPLVWVAFSFAGRDMEMSCDEAIMREMDKDIRAQYSASLLHLATGRKVLMSSTLSFGEGNPKQRIKNIMNYKKPAFWVILVSITGCILVAITLLSNPISSENTSISEDVSTNGVLEENTSIPANESVNESEETQQNSVSPNETVEPDGLEDTETSLFHPEYERLIKLAEEVLQDPIKAQEEQKRYVDENGEPLFSTELFVKSDDPSQELGYLVQDMNGDGIKELMFGVNFLDGEYEEHFILDLYTLKNDKAIHVFDGWWRNRYYPTDNGDFINFWTASAEEHGYILYQFDGEKLNEGEEIPEENLEKYNRVYPYFIPFGADWEELEDIDGNGQPEYVVYYDEDNGDSYEHNVFVYAFNLEKIYRHEDLLFVDVRDTKYMDLDRDEEKEVAIRMFPHVNSMPLMEYAVIKEKNGNWEKLEMYQGEDILDNTFPISIVKGEGQFEAKLSVDGLDKELIINFENRYNYWKKAAEDTVEYASFAQSAKYYYDWEILNMRKDSVCAHTSAWGVWNIQYGTYKEQDCLIAEQGIQGYSKEDLWGNVFIYFDYASNGKIRILDLTFIPYEEEYVSSFVRSQVEVFASHWDELHTSLDEEPTDARFALVDLNHDDVLELLVSEQIGTGHYTYTGIYQVQNGQIKEIKNNMQFEGSEPDLIVSWLDMYRDPDTALEYYVTQDDLRIYAREYYQTYGGIYLSEDGNSLEYELIAREHVLYEPERHEYCDASNQDLSKNNFEKLIENFYQNKGYEHKQVHLSWMEKRKASEYEGTYAIETRLINSYQGFREVDGNVDFQKLSADIRFDSDSRKFYFSSQGIETSDGFDIMPYWDYILNTARMEESRDSLYHRYSLFLGGEMDEEEYPGQFSPGEWQVETQDEYFVAYRQVYGFEQFGDLWGRMEVPFSLSEQGNITVRKVAFIPTDSMKRLAGQYSGGDYMESYQEIIKAYRTFAEEIKESWELATAYQVVGRSYICEEYAAAVSTGTPVYLIDDMNQDGIPELFIGIQDNQGNTNIYDIYTWSNHSSYQLLRGIGYRNGTCILCEDGIIKNITNVGNGEYRIKYQRLPRYSTTLETFGELNVFREDTGAYTYEYQEEIISKNEADRIMERYREIDLKLSNMLEES